MELIMPINSLCHTIKVDGKKPPPIKPHVLETKHNHQWLSDVKHVKLSITTWTFTLHLSLTFYICLQFIHVIVVSFLCWKHGCEISA